MEKLKINELEVGKIYRFYTDDEEDLSESIYMINGRGDLYCGDPLSCKSKKDFFKSSLSYNEVKNNYFVEIKREIDWSKVPRGTKVQVRDGANEKWKNAYFLELDTIDEYPFRVSFSLDDNFTEFKMEHRTNCFDYCRIHESVEIPDDWYKEVE